MLIGLLGYIGSGKGTAGTILADRGYTPVSFASRVKDVVSAIFGWDRALLEGDTEESRVFRETPDSYWSGVWGRPYTPREALQKMGTEAGRTAFHKDLWVKALIRDLKPTQNYVITDVRFPNEIKAIYESGGVLIEISRGTPPEWYGEAYETNRMDAWSGLLRVGLGWPSVSAQSCRQ
jgi:hypothetical protein